jgi:small-conductance mechanosensitive channel
MRTRKSLTFLVFLLLVSFFHTSNALSQETGLLDSLLNETFQENAIKETVSTDSISDEEAKIIGERNKRLGQILTQLISRTKKYSLNISKIKTDLIQPLDTMEMLDNLPILKNYLSSMEVLSQDTSETVNSRFLTGMGNLLQTIHQETSKYEEILSNRIEILNESNALIQEIKNDSILYLSQEERETIPELNNELSKLEQNIKTIEKNIFDQEIKLTRIQASLSDLNSRFISLERYFYLKKREVARKSWDKEINFIWEPKSYSRDSTTYSQILSKSISANQTISYIFLKRNITSIILFVVFAILILWFSHSTIKSIKLEKDHSLVILARSKFFKNHQISSTFVFLLPLLFIFFSRPPMAFASILSLIFCILVTFLIKSHFPNKIYKYWIWFFPLNFIIPTIGLNWDNYFDERYFLLFANLIAIIQGVLIVKFSKETKYTGVKLLRFLSTLTISFELFAFIVNCLGRYNLAKLFTIAGISSFYRGVGLYIFTLVVLEAVYLLLESKKNASSITSYFDFQELESRLSGFLYLIGFSIWAYGILYYLGYFEPIFNTITEFLYSERILGDTSFTFGTIALFIVILLISYFLANNIAYFFSARDQKTATSRKNRLGSSILLIRLSIFILGFMIAAAAAKIPLDKITIVLGALSVGIGFGLQTIINNLVSGIILAFERPIQIGDEIEVGTNSGTVKEVGIRASKIQAYDGSEIVVPNGDLLSQSLINWTLSDKRRRIELIIGVGYDSEMKQVKEILEQVLDRDQILKVPKPKVLLQNFGDSSVDFRLLFWVESMDIWIDKRAEVMTAIFEAFSENGIEIPYPKRDLYLKTFPSNWSEKISKPGDNPGL